MVCHTISEMMEGIRDFDVQDIESRLRAIADEYELQQLNPLLENEAYRQWYFAILEVFEENDEDWF